MMNTTPKEKTMQITIKINGEQIAQRDVDVKGRFYFGSEVISPLIREHGDLLPGLEGKTVDAGLVTFRCTDGTVIEEVIAR